MKRRRKQLELIIDELQAIRAHLEQGPPTVSTNYTITTSGFADVTGVPAGDPGLVLLQELINNPNGARAEELREMPVVEVPEGKSVVELIKEALQQHDQDLVNKLTRAATPKAGLGNLLKGQ